MCYLTRTLYHKCKHSITTQTHCADESAPWHSIQDAAFSSIVLSPSLCPECQDQATTATATTTTTASSPRINHDAYTLPPSYRTHPIESCLRPDGSVETYQDIMTRKTHEAETAKIQIHAYPTLDPLSPPKWLQQKQNRKAIFNKIRERRKEDLERIRQSIIDLEFESDCCQGTMEASVSDSGYASEATEEAAEPRDVPLSEDSAEVEEEPESVVLEASGGLSPVNAGRWARQRRLTTAKLRERLARAHEETARRTASQKGHADIVA